MLIYTRRTAGSDDSPGLTSSDDDLLIGPSRAPLTITQAPALDIPEPPLHAAREVDRLNAIFDQEIKQYEAQYAITDLFPFYH